NSVPSPASRSMFDRHCSDCCKLSGQCSLTFETCGAVNLDVLFDPKAHEQLTRTNLTALYQRSRRIRLYRREPAIRFVPRIIGLELHAACHCAATPALIPARRWRNVATCLIPYQFASRVLSDVQFVSCHFCGLGRLKDSKTMMAWEL